MYERMILKFTLKESVWRLGIYVTEYRDQWSVEICALLGYYTGSCGNCLQTFRVNVSVSSSLIFDP
jgi:hypothetical protein